MAGPSLPASMVEDTRPLGDDEDAPLLPEHSVGSAGSTRAHRRPLDLLPLVALIFYEVSGGPYGTEDAVSAATPLVVMLGFVVLPLVWSVPEALVTAELSTTFPENSGYVAWVTAAFGPFWGFQKGFWAWISGVTDNAVYPVMILTYVEQAFPAVKYLAGGWGRTAFLVALNLSLTLLNWRGLHIVGGAAVAMMVFTMVPFALMTLLAIPRIDVRNWLRFFPAPKEEPIDWRTFFNVMFWNLNYWNSASCLSGEIEDPGRNIPRAFGGAVVLVVLSYLVPIATGLGVEPSREAWGLGFFTTLASRLGGPLLGGWIVAGAAVAQVGQFEAEMCSDSYQLHGMAERGFLPAAFAVRSRYGTPTLGIVASSVGVLAMASFDFLRIVELLNCVYCLSELLEFAAFLRLRVKYPTLARPFRIPFGTVGCALMLLPAGALLLAFVLVPIVELDLVVAVFTLGAMAVGFALYPLLQLAGRRGLLRFRGMTPAAFKEHLYSMYVPGDAGEQQPWDAAYTQHEFGIEDLFQGFRDGGEDGAGGGEGGAGARTPRENGAAGAAGEPGAEERRSARSSPRGSGAGPEAERQAPLIDLGGEEGAARGGAAGREGEGEEGAARGGAAGREGEGEEGAARGGAAGEGDEAAGSRPPTPVPAGLPRIAVKPQPRPPPSAFESRAKERDGLFTPLGETPSSAVRAASRGGSGAGEASERFGSAAGEASERLGSSRLGSSALEASPSTGRRASVRRHASRGHASPAVNSIEFRLESSMYIDAETMTPKGSAPGPGSPDGSRASSPRGGSPWARPFGRGGSGLASEDATPLARPARPDDDLTSPSRSALTERRRDSLGRASSRFAAEIAAEALAHAGEAAAREGGGED